MIAFARMIAHKLVALFAVRYVNDKQYRVTVRFNGRSVTHEAVSHDAALYLAEYMNTKGYFSIVHG